MLRQGGRQDGFGIQSRGRCDTAFGIGAAWGVLDGRTGMVTYDQGILEKKRGMRLGTALREPLRRYESYREMHLDDKIER